MILELLLLSVGVVVLYFGAEWLVKGAARIAARLDVRPIVVGLTVVSLGTSAPELVVCVLATLGGSGDLAVGNVLGSNLANMGLILGATAVLRPLVLAGRVVARELPIMLLVTLLLIPLIIDLELTRVDGAILLVIFVLYIGFVAWSAEAEALGVGRELDELEEDPLPATVPAPVRDAALVVLGSGALVLGGRMIVDNAIVLASSLGISELVIGFTIVAIGTSLPELATSVVAAVRKESDIAVGNIVGSNIFNLTAVLGASSLVDSIVLQPSVIDEELPAVVAMSVLFLAIALRSRNVRRWEGALLLTGYVGMGLWVFL